MTNGNAECVMEFLHKSIEDVQGTIRSLDAKAGIGIVILGAMLSQILDREELSSIKEGGWLSLSIFAVFAVLATVSAVLAMKTIFPMVNPAQNVDLVGSPEPAFFVSGLKISSPLRLFSSRRRFAALRESHTHYDAALEKASPDHLRKIRRLKY